MAPLLFLPAFFRARFYALCERALPEETSSRRAADPRQDRQRCYVPPIPAPKRVCPENCPRRARCKIQKNVFLTMPLVRRIISAHDPSTP